MADTVQISNDAKQTLLGRITSTFVFLFEKIMPDPYIFAVLLTFLGAALAWKFAPNASRITAAVILENSI